MTKKFNTCRSSGWALIGGIYKPDPRPNRALFEAHSGRTKITTGSPEELINKHNMETWMEIK